MLTHFGTFLSNTILKNNSLLVQWVHLMLIQVHHNAHENEVKFELQFQNLN